VTDKRQAQPLIREGAPQRQHNFQAESNIWSQVPEWTQYQDILTDLAISRNMTLTLSRSQILEELTIVQIGTRKVSSRWRAHCESLWQWDGKCLGTQEGEHPPLEAGT
jgi:hypothetical protein